MAHELIDARARIAELEAAQRPTLGYVVGFPAGLDAPEGHVGELMIEHDGGLYNWEQVEAALQHLAFDEPYVPWCLAELREVSE